MVTKVQAEGNRELRRGRKAHAGRTQLDRADTRSSTSKLVSTPAQLSSRTFGSLEGAKISVLWLLLYILPFSSCCIVTIDIALLYKV